MVHKWPGWLPSVLAVALSGGAYSISTGLGEVWAALWVAPIPVLCFAFGTSRRVAAALAAGAAYLLGGLNTFGYLTRVAPVPIAVLAVLAPAVVFAALVLASRYAVRRLSPWLAAFAFPCVWTAYEFVSSLVSPHGTFASLAYSQTDALPVLQIVSITGIWGVTFLVTLVPSAVSVAWNRRAISALLPAAAIIVVVLGYGAIRLQQGPQGPLVRVGLAATDRGVGAAFATQDPALAVAVARAYAGRIARLGARGAQVVVLPEKLVGVTPGDAAEVLSVFAEAARAARVTLIAGLNRVAIDPLRNVAVVFGPDGQVITEYDKHHMLPGPETGYKIGGTPALFPALGAQWGVAICKDMDFPVWSRAYGRSGVRLLAVPAWDFVVDGRLHGRMAVVRGVENGFTVARVAQQGLLTFSDANGRILAEEASSKTPDALLVRDIAPGPGSTFYTRFGDWFGWTVVVSVLALLAATARRRAG